MLLLLSNVTSLSGSGGKREGLDYNDDDIELRRTLRRMTMQRTSLPKEKAGGPPRQ